LQFLLVVTEWNDARTPLSTFSHAGKTYQLIAFNDSAQLAAHTATPSAPSSNAKPILIPVNFDKKRNAHTSNGNGEVRNSVHEPPMRPASTSVLLHPSSSKGDVHVPTLPAIPVEMNTTPIASAHHYATAPSSPDAGRRSNSMLSSSGAFHGSVSDMQYSYSTDSDFAVAEGTYIVNPETGEVTASSGPSSSSSSSVLPNSLPSSVAPSPNINISTSATAGTGGSIIRYFMNDEVAKHRVRIQGESTVRTFSSILKVHHKLAQDFAVFMFDLAENRLRVLKDTTQMDGTQVYYVLENARIDDLYRKVEKRVKKDLAALGAQSGKTSTWNSDNNPLRVDFVPDTELYLTEAGRIGLCMCPGRKKKKAAHEWDRDLEKDLLRIRDHYKCDVVVSLVRRSELVELRIPTLLEEVEKMGMESIHFPIKDKWIPDSMAGVIRLVDTLVQRLKVGKTIVIHCNGGKGRSGTVAVACMVAMGKRVVQSIDVVRKARSGTIRNPVQVVYVKRFKTAFKSYLKKKQALIEARGGTMVKEDWEALADQVAQDAGTMGDGGGDSSDSESEMSETSNKKAEKAQEKARKEEEKAQEKAEKAQEKARKEEEKAQEKAEKAQEKARKEEEKAQEKARKEEKNNRKGEEKVASKKDKPNSAGTPQRGSAEIDPSTLASLAPVPIDPLLQSSSSQSHILESTTAETKAEVKTGSTTPDSKPKSTKPKKNEDKTNSEKIEKEKSVGQEKTELHVELGTPKATNRRKSAKKLPMPTGSEDVIASTGSD
jgi:protein-tyrosine phosphatase